MKTIVIYTDSLKPSGGRERVITNLLRAWENKYNLILVTKDDGQSFYELPKKMVLISLKNPLNLNMNNRVSRIFSIAKGFSSSIKSLKKVLKKIEYDYIYVATPLNALEAYLAMKAPQKQLVVSEHASAFAFNTLYTKMKKYVYPKAYCISVLNKTDTEIYKQWGANAIYIPHLVTYKAEQKNSLNTKIALNVGRLTKDKQQELLLDMWAKIKDKKGWILWIVGDGEEHDQLERKIAELQMQDSVRLLPATQSIEDIYKKASFFVFSSKSEGFGMVLLEAMSFGIPCISFDCPSGPRDIVENNRNGFLIENNNVEEYVLKLKQITSMSVENLMILGNAAFETVHEWDNASILELWDRIFK